MADSPFQPNVPYIADGEPVDQNVANRPLQVLAQNENYLRNRLDAAALSEALLAPGVTVAPAVLEGQPVAWNSAAARFEPALAQAVLDPASGQYVPGPLTACLGVCVRKTAATLADVGLGGRVAVPLAAAVAGTPVGTSPPAGFYYLSGVTPGQLTRQRPPVAVPVLFWDGQYAYISPTLHEFLESHVHLRRPLVCRPAGQNTIEGGRHTVTAPDATLPGWLPADHASFAGTAPVGAAFGYNLAEDPELDSVWPPQPLASVVAFWDKAIDHAGGTLVPLGLDGLLAVDRNGLWWMSDCLGDVPWPVDYDADNPPPGVSANSIAGPECARAEAMALWVSFTEMLFATDKAVVTSLAPAAGSRLRLTGPDGRPAAAGPLVIDLDDQSLIDPALTAGDLALKGLAADGRTFLQGPVVEGLVAGAGAVLSSTRPRTAGGVVLHQGTVTVTVPSNVLAWELAPSDVRLLAARQRYLDTLGVMYLGLLAASASAVRYQFEVPAAGLPANPTLTVRFVIYAGTAGTLPGLTLTARRLPAPAAGTPLVLAATTEGALAVQNAALTLTSGQYATITGAPLAVAPGDTVLFSLSRAGSDGYTGEVGIIRASAVLATAAP